MFSIYDGRETFYQWDINRKLIVEDETIKQVHFCNRTGDCALVCEVYNENGKRVVDVPNILLQTDWKIRVYAYDGNYTKHDACYEVVSRNKPADYAYTETEILNYETMNSKIDANTKAITKKANSTDVYTKSQITNMLNNKANKSDIVNAYCYKGSLPTIGDLPQKWDIVAAGAPTCEGEECGTYDEENGIVTMFEGDYYDREVIFPIKPIVIEETSNYYFCDNLAPGIGYIGDYFFHIYDCADGYGGEYQRLTKGKVINKIIIVESYYYDGEEYSNLGTLYRGNSTFYEGEDWDEDGELDYEYASIPYDAFKNGTVYNVLENDINYAWNGEAWDALGGNHIDTFAREEIERLKAAIIALGGSV